jgi:outer membrane receptor protein involved in Fe transport
LDASLAYDVNKHLTVMASALNLADEREFTYSSVPGQTFSYGDTGRRFTFGARMRF